MTDFWQYLKNSSKPIFLYGMGNGADKIIDTLDTLGIRVSGVFASDGFVRNKTFRGFKLQSYSDVCDKYDDFTVLLSFGTSIKEVIENIKYIASHRRLFAPDLAVFGDGFIDCEFCQKNKERLEMIYSSLADEISKNTFENILKFKISGDISYLLNCESSPSEPFENFLNLNKDTVFVDLGAYRGDTLCEYIERVGGYKKAYAVEPDKKTFEKLLKTNLENTVYVNAAVSDKQGVCFFESQAGRGSHVSSSGIEIESVCVDSLLCGQKPDYIKMDVEGAEKQAIDGAKNTIVKYKPKLCISAYHRAYDLLDIPEQIFSIRKDYKIYLRHFPYIPAWDTNYYFI